MREIVKAIKKSKNIAIFSHKSPDPDAIGSALALKSALEKIGKKVGLFCDDEMTGNFGFLMGFEEYNTKNLEGFDLFISVDVASSQLLGKFEEQFVNFANNIKIDHHASGSEFAKVELVNHESACAIVIFELIEALKIKIDSNIATDIYFGICGDTGIFRNNNTDSKTFLVCSELLKLGAEYRKVYSEFFDKRTIENLFLTSNAILNAIINDDEKYAIMSVSTEDYEKFGANESESIGNLPNVFLNCGYKIAAILKQKTDGIHVSFRSKFDFDVSKIAEKFGGGGHKNASGCSIIDSIQNAENMVEKEIKNYLKENKWWKVILKLHKKQNFYQWRK